MAIIHGIPEAEKQFLDKLPKQIKSLEDISEEHQKLTDEYDELEKK